MENRPDPASPHSRPPKKSPRRCGRRFDSVCQKFFPLIPSPPAGGEGQGEGGHEKTSGNEYNGPNQGRR